MRISELSRAADVPVPTIKYYLREGLLSPGVATAPNQASYDETHVHRLRLIQVLRDVGGLGIAQVHDVVRAIDDPDLPRHAMLGVAQYALGPPPDDGPVPDDVVAARGDVDRFLRTLGWNTSDEAPARRVLADALVALRRLGRDAGTDAFVPYARAAERVAAAEIATGRRNDPREDAVEWAVTGTVVFESALNALRRLALEHHSAKRFGERRR